MSKKIDIVSLFTKDYSKRMSGREIARLLNTNHQTALNNLNELVKEDIIKYELKGRNKEYSLNLNSLKTNLMAVMSEVKLSLDSLQNKELKIVIEEIVPNTEAIILFGSFASSSHDKDSDMDLILVGKSDKESISKIIKRHNREINAEYASFEDFAGSLNKKNALAIEIAKNHLFYGDISRITGILLKWHLR